MHRSFLRCRWRPGGRTRRRPSSISTSSSTFTRWTKSRWRGYRSKRFRKYLGIVSHEVIGWSSTTSHWTCRRRWTPGWWRCLVSVSWPYPKTRSAAREEVNPVAPAQESQLRFKRCYFHQAVHSLSRENWSALLYAHGTLVPGLNQRRPLNWSWFDMVLFFY